MYVGTANSSVHVGPRSFRTNDPHVSCPAVLFPPPSMCTAVFFYRVGCSSSSRRELRL